MERCKARKRERETRGRKEGREKGGEKGKEGERYGGREGKSRETGRKEQRRGAFCSSVLFWFLIQGLMKPRLTLNLRPCCLHPELGLQAFATMPGSKVFIRASVSTT